MNGELSSTSCSKSENRRRFENLRSSLTAATEVKFIQASEHVLSVKMPIPDRIGGRLRNMHAQTEAEHIYAARNIFAHAEMFRAEHLR